MSEGTEDILSIIQPETPSAGGETGAGGADAKGSARTPDKEAGGDASGREGRSGDTGPTGAAVTLGAAKAGVGQRMNALDMSGEIIGSAGL
jgi:hypothetical protein